MPSHTLPGSAPALFSHVVADNAPLYRAVLDVFAAAKRQFRLLWSAKIGLWVLKGFGFASVA
jgi:hypothetical protein